MASLRKATAEGLSYPARDSDMKKKLVWEEPARKTLIELGKSGSLDKTYEDTNSERLELAKIRGEGYIVKVKYGALRGREDRDAKEGKAATGALAKLTLANSPRYKKVFNEKQCNDCRRNVLVNLDNKIEVRGAGVVQNIAKPRKEMTKVGPDTQGREVLQRANQDSGAEGPSKGQQQITKVAGASLAKHGIMGNEGDATGAKKTKELEQGSKEQGPLRWRASGSLQQQGPQGAKEQEKRTTGVEHVRELPRAYRNRGLQEQGREKQGPPGSRASESYQQRGHPRERKKGSMNARVEKRQEPPATKASRRKGLQERESEEQDQKDRSFQHPCRAQH